MNKHYDCIIIGSGAGGCAAAQRLARSGARVLLLEKGGRLPLDGSTQDVDKVIRQGLFKSREPWLDSRGRCFTPEEYFNLGGKTKWYGAAVLRMDAHEFAADPDHQCPAWPISADDMADVYAQAEHALQVRCFDIEAGLADILRRLRNKAPGWLDEPLPLALAADILLYPGEARHFDAFASAQQLKQDAELAFLEPVLKLPNLTIRTDSTVCALLASRTSPQQVAGVRIETGQHFYADRILLAAGALHSPRLLQDYLDRTGLASQLPVTQQVGRNYKQHVLSAVIAFTPRRQTDLLRKTRLLLHADYPHSSVQPLGFDAELIAALMPAFIPRRLARWLGRYAYGFFLQTEDGSHPDNRVLTADAGGLPRLDYRAARLPAATREHRGFVRRFVGDLLRSGMLAISRGIPLSGTAHACGSLRMGHDPCDSVVAPDGKVHGFTNLYVVDGSVLPRSSRVNPSLTIFAWALRVSEQLVQNKEEFRNESVQQSASA